jgi:hypothetical protein
MYSRDKIIETMQEIYEGSKVIAPYVMVAQPSRSKHETPVQHFDGYEGLHVDFLGFSHGFCNIYGEKVDVARNYLIEEAIASGAKYLLFAGDDTCLPYDAFKILHDTAEKNPNSVVTGVYYIKISDAMIMVREDNWIKIPNVDPGQIIEAWQTGMDVMLIPIDILRRMKEEEPELPFCCIGSNINDEIPFIGEDNFFVHRLHKMGVKLLVNTDVQCLHVDTATGKYTAHPDVDLRKYYTNFPITVPLTLEDKKYIDERWTSRMPEGSNSVPNKLQKMLDEGKPIKFNMGCGQDQIEGYIGVDIYNERADIKEDLVDMRMLENCADEIYASHVLEHIPQHLAIGLLEKWHYALKPSGKLIMEMPNIEELFKEFATATDDERYMITLCVYGANAHVSPEDIANGTSSPHVWGYYPKILSEILENIGFTDIEVLPQQGLHPGKNFRIEAVK